MTAFGASECSIPPDTEYNMWKKKPKPVSDHLRRNAEYSLQKLEHYTNRRDNPSAVNDNRTYVLDCP